MIENQNYSTQEELFFKPIVDSYIQNPRFIHRDWLANQVQQAMNQENCRFVLLTAEPSAGKSTFSAQLAHDHPDDWLVYFIRRDQREPLGDVGAKSFLLRIGYQLASLHPNLFSKEQLKVSVDQRVGATGRGSEIIGVEVGRLIASPFYQKVIDIQQNVQNHNGRLVGLHVKELIVEERQMDLEDLQHLALIDPANSLLRQDPTKRIMVLVDALDEIRFHNTQQHILSWLIDCPELPSNVRFILTSRPSDQTLELFSQAKKRVLQPLSINPDDLHLQTDLNEYMTQLVSIPQLREELAKTSQGLAGFTTQAIEKAHGNLGYLDALGRAIDQALIHRDDLGLGMLRDLLSLQTLPGEIEDLYAFFLHAIKIRVGQEQAWSTIYRRILSVLAVAFEPLTLTQLKSLGKIQVSVQDIADALDRLRQFLDVKENRVRLYHSTLPEFLTEPKTGENLNTADLYVDPKEWHQQIGNYYWNYYPADWSHCDDYGLKFIALHMAKAVQGYNHPLQQEALRKLESMLNLLLFDFGWIQAKLNVTDINSVIDDYDLLPAPPDVKLVRDALRLSAHILAKDKTQLAGQLLGRLMEFEHPQIVKLLAEALKYHQSLWLCPLTPSLNSPDGDEKETFQGYADVVTSLAITPDGKRVVSGSWDGKLRIWNLAQGSVQYIITGHDSVVEAVAITPDGKQVISVSWDATLKVWDLDGCKEVRTLRGHESAVVSVAITSDGERAISASYDDTLKVWNIRTGEEERTLRGHSGHVHSVVVTNDGKYAVSGSEDRTIIIWNLETGEKMRILRGHSDEVASVKITTDGESLVSASFDKTLRVWNFKNGVEKRILKGHFGNVNTLMITTDGKYVISGSDDRTLRIWNLKSGEAERTLRGHSAAVTSIAITPDGEFLSGSKDKTIRVWDPRTNVKESSKTSGSFYLSKFTILPDDQNVTSEFEDQAMIIKNLTSRVENFILKGNSSGVNAVAVAGNGKWAISTDKDNILRTWDLETGKETLTLKGHRSTVSAVAVTPDRKRAISAAWDKTLKVWNLENGREEHTLRGHQDIVTEVVITPDGQKAVSASYDGSIRVWILADGESRQTLSSRFGKITCLAIAPDGRHIVFGTEEPTVRIWDLNSSDAPILGEHADWVTAAAVTADGRRAVSASWDKTLKVWDLVNGKEERVLHGHVDGVNSLAIASSGNVISASNDHTIKIWELNTGIPIATFQGDVAFKHVGASMGGIIIAYDAVGHLHFLRLIGST